LTEEPKYYDIRHVSGISTHIDIDNSVVESAGSSFFDTAVIRVLGRTGWGVLTVDNFGEKSSAQRYLISLPKVAAILFGFLSSI